MITLVIPFIDGWEFLERTVKRAVGHSRHPFELLLIDNGSDDSYQLRVRKLLKANVHFQYIRNQSNLGVIESFNQGLAYAKGDVLCFIHSDVLLQEVAWERKIEYYFENDSKLGLAGLFGGDGVAPDGGRMNPCSNMLGKEWGQCDCHKVAGEHHGSIITTLRPAVVLDGVGLFFRRDCLQQIKDKTDALDTNVRAPHHWYDRNLTLYAVDLGWRVGTIGVAFDHYSGATANSSQKYQQSALDWLAAHPDWQAKHGDKGPDAAIYWVGENQFRQEWGPKLTAIVGADHEIRWNA